MCYFCPFLSCTEVFVFKNRLSWLVMRLALNVCGYVSVDIIGDSDQFAESFNAKTTATAC